MLHPVVNDDGLTQYSSFIRVDVLGDLGPGKQ